MWSWESRCPRRTGSSRPDDPVARVGRDRDMPWFFSELYFWDVCCGMYTDVKKAVFRAYYNYKGQRAFGGGVMVMVVWIRQ